MITQRFRPLGWVAGVAVAATVLYLISLQVASERARLDDIDHRIAVAKRDIRQLETELGTRASLRQLERWNGEVLALSAPKTSQFLRNEAQLARFDGDALDRDGAAPPASVAVMTSPEAQSDAPPSPASMVPGLIDRIAAVASSPRTVVMSATDKAVQAAIAKPRPKIERIAAVDQRLLDRSPQPQKPAAAGKPQAKARP